MNILHLRFFPNDFKLLLTTHIDYVSNVRLASAPVPPIISVREDVCRITLLLFGVINGSS